MLGIGSDLILALGGGGDGSDGQGLLLTEFWGRFRLGGLEKQSFCVLGLYHRRYFSL